MLLPNAENAIVDIRKLRDYCLNPDSPQGRHKACVFATALGLMATDAEILRSELLRVALVTGVETGELDRHGQRYTLDFLMETAIGRAMVRSGWIVLYNESFPRLATCYVLKEKS